MYSYDVSASPGRSATASRSIPGMRPSYDAEHPHSATPIYDELYSEYRRLFRALPGDRSGEEDLKFTGFAVRDSYPLLGEQQQQQQQQPYPPQQQAFHTLAGHVPGLPQFMPGPQHHGSGPTGGQQHGHAGAQPHSHSHSHSHNGAHTGSAHANTHTNTHPGSHPATHTAGNPSGTHAAGSHLTGRHHGHSGGHAEPAVTTPAHASAPAPAPVGDGPGHTATAPSQDQPALSAAQFTNGQGWVATGYLGAAPHPMPVPAPPPPAPPAPAPVMGTVDGLAPTRPSGGRHRQMLSLPPGPTADHR
ncbi:hypothetical protein ACFWP2_33755 [Kitasatospora sp. NPDC058444]|uniref:hypothetical protein n=1 Tax=Kitasatospora sp. NPDC058444 TaxID=3346504 RepID=UPI00364FCBD1